MALDGDFLESDRFYLEPARGVLASVEKTRWCLLLLGDVTRGDDY